MNQRKVNPLLAQLPSVGLILGVLFSTFVAVLFALNLGVAMICGVVIGSTAGWLVRKLTLRQIKLPVLTDQDLVNPELLN